MSDDKKTNPTPKPDASTDKIAELPPKKITESDAQSVKGGAASTGKWAQ